MPVIKEDPSEKKLIFPMMERILFLKHVEMFKNIDSEKLMVIARIAQRVFFAKGEVLSKQNEAGDTLYIILSGSIRVIREEKGGRTVLSILAKGDCYGTWGLFGNQPRSATAEANEDCTLLMIRKSEFREVLYENPEITYNLLEIYSELLKKANSEVSVLNKMLSDGLQKSLT